MDGWMRIERREETGDWSTQHEGEFLFPDDEVINAAAALLSAFTDFDDDMPIDRLRLAVWSNKLPAKERDLSNTVGVFTLGIARLAGDEENTWTHAARLLRWGALKSFSCQDAPNPVAVLMANVPLPSPFAGALQTTNKRLYWYHPTDGVDTGCESEKQFAWVLEGYEQAWLTFRSRQRSSTWTAGEERAISERLKIGSINSMVRDLHNRLGEEADERLHDLLKTKQEALSTANGDDEEVERIEAQFEADVRRLYFEYDAKANL